MRLGRSQKVNAGFLVVWMVFWTAGIIVAVWISAAAALGGDLAAGIFLAIWLAAAGFGLFPPCGGSCDHCHRPAAQAEHPPLGRRDRSARKLARLAEPLPKLPRRPQNAGLNPGEEPTPMRHATLLPGLALALLVAAAHAQPLRPGGAGAGGAQGLARRPRGQSRR